MTPWEKRPVEIANLLNPAFCGEVLRRCINSYQQTTTQPFPYPLTFLVLPIILHRRTRELISRRQRQSLHAWLQSHQEVKIGFAERTTELLSVTKEALIFLLQVKALALNEHAELGVISYKRTSVQGQDEDEIVDCYRKAEIVGRLFAQAGTITTIYTILGVRP